MKQVNLYEAKTHLSALVDQAAAGEELVIAKNGKPRARLLALPEAEVKPRGKRRFGYWGRKYPDWRPPEVFRETTGQGIALWEDGPVFPPDDPE
ncbi:type II toxin-antitoxin system prevent-host-death family antitoxin [Phenylobacterium sp.]|uniref:type II toxin-antitoxin system Phd/YefM family antitoxin n=1 Tax=Phenylobacterium sp. TaxID=1871053 RepID=UPI0025FB082C|nr:type II toxin-antitoxin system prevent-host-death family antitoxin [Phenylobacterium sp.]